MIEYIIKEKEKIIDYNSIDVTNLLEHYTILCDVKSQGIGIKAGQLKSREKVLQYVTREINDGSVRNINQETGINNRDLSGIDR